MNISTKWGVVLGMAGAGLFSVGQAVAADEVVQPQPQAEAAKAAEPASPHTWSANIGLYGQYVFRGITYTRGKPAVQGSIDYSHSSGAYLGVWATNTSKDSGLYDNGMEIDLYGGWVKQFTEDFGINLGFLQFYYPMDGTYGSYTNNKAAFGDESLNTLELSAAATWKWFTLKYSYAVTDFFGINNTSMGDGKGDSDGSDYVELNFNYAFPHDINLALHAGHQRVEGRSQFDYTDFLVGVNKNFSIGQTTGWNAGVNWTTTDADRALWIDGKGKYAGNDHVILFIKKTF